MAKRHLIAVLVQGLVSPIEFSLAAEIFGRPPPEFGLKDWYDFAICSPAPGTVWSGGLALHVRDGIEILDDADTIIIPSWDNSVRSSPTLIRTLEAAAHRGCRLVSMSSGSFLLGRCGLLDGRRVAAHWLHARDLALRYPQAIIESDVLYVDDGSLITGAGSSSGLDMLLYIIRKDHGVRISNLLARRLIAPPHRSGSQAQQVSRPVPCEADENFGNVFDFLRTNGDRVPSPKRLAEIAGMSPRNLNRKFKQTIGCSVFEWLRQEKVSIAKELLEQSDHSVEEIGFRAGFRTTHGFRRAFLQQEGILPKDYRKQCQEALRRRLSQSRTGPTRILHAG